MSARAVDPSILEIAGHAHSCTEIDSLANAIRACTACPELAATRQHVVVGDSRPGARLLIVGEAPGATEDAEGRPFLGKGGQLLDRMMADAGLQRSETSVLNVLKCRPPSNRTPSRAEAARCTGWLDRQVALLDPPLVVTLGRSALTWALNASTRLADVRGQVLEWRDRRLIASYHPSAALRFGPNGEPHAALAADLHLVAETLAWI
ncbi:MAG TPA: uracil-DNA glycosylase [Mycobacteriales bacterium]|nr:uracil-DNA glycosylase [Mycobacteriales bacterium]